MSYRKTQKLINDIIKNEFVHVQENQASEKTIKDFEINVWCQKTCDLFEKLLEVAPEHKDLLDEFESTVTAYWSGICKYYFKKGVSAGTSNLNFIRDITNGANFY